MNEHVYTAEWKLATSQAKQSSATPKTSKSYQVADLPVDLSVGCRVVYGSNICSVLIESLGRLIGR